MDAVMVPVATSSSLGGFFQKRPGMCRAVGCRHSLCSAYSDLLLSCSRNSAPSLVVPLDASAADLLYSDSASCVGLVLGLDRQLHQSALAIGADDLGFDLV